MELPILISNSFWGILLITAAVQFKTWTGTDPKITALKTPQFKSFQRNFLIVYLLAFFADWLKGPYVYALYADYGYDASAIAQLFICGFLASMIVGTIVGGLSDKFGRRMMCVAFSVCYIIAGITKVYNHFWILMLGRFLSGIATSLLFSTFESWMVTEHKARGFDPALLEDTFSLCTLGNGIIAITAGQVAQVAADNYGYVAPFLVCLIPLSLVGIIVSSTWNENYGDAKIEILSTFTNAWKAIMDDKSVLMLGIAQSAFEGAMYTFVFMWTPALRSFAEEDLPFGAIFATFMVCCMLGSAVFSMIRKTIKIEDVPYVIHGIAIIANFAVVLFIENKNIVYLAFLLFEVGCGIFYPTYGTIRSKYIPEAQRSSIMNFFRVPLNAFVVVVLIKVKFMEPSQVFAITTGAHFVGLIAFMQFRKSISV